MHIFFGYLKSLTKNLSYCVSSVAVNFMMKSSCYVSIDHGELDAAIAIVADLETSGITVPDQTLDRVISARQMIDIAVNDVTS